MTLVEQLKKGSEWKEKEKRRRMETERKKRAKQQRQIHSCQYAAGKLLCKYFPALQDLDYFDICTQSVPATEKLESILHYLSESPQCVQALLEKAGYKESQE